VRSRTGASNTQQAACGPQEDFVQPTMLFGNYQSIKLEVI